MKYSKRVPFGKPILDSLVKYSNLTNKCPIPSGFYIVRNLTVDLSIIPLKAIFKPDAIFIYKAKFLEKINKKFFHIHSLKVSVKFLKLC